MVPDFRKVAVVGPAKSDNETLIGSLIYKCGLRMRDLAELEAVGDQDMSDIPRTWRQIGRSLTFETKSIRYDVVGETKAADVVLVLLNSVAPVDSALRCLEREISALRTAKTRVIVLVTNLEISDWSAEQTKSLMQSAHDCLQHSDLVSKSIIFIPISIGQGDNILESSDGRLSHTFWSKDSPKKAMTLFDALDT